MTVHFIGAGPGAADLITVRGQRLIGRCPVVLYAGSLVPAEVLASAPPNARIIDTASLTLDRIVEEMYAADGRGQDVARVHSGDPSLYGAIGEQMRRLDALGIDYDITPGVPAYAAAAATLRRELTLPDISQTLVLTRTAMRSSAMPNREDLETLGRSGATLAIHLSVRNLRHVVDTLTPIYGAGCPVAVVVRASWPDERVIRGTLSTIREQVRREKIRRTALILVGRVLASEDFADSHLYDSGHFHVLRPKKVRPKKAQSKKARSKEARSKEARSENGHKPSSSVDAPTL
ncbi:MAG: precorrin-4 C(11)-methyltransferase [Gammaproteobacteria bacterium]